MEERWTKAHDYDEDWSVAIAHAGGYVYAFGAESNGTDTAYLVTRRYDLNQYAPPSGPGLDLATTWPQPDESDPPLIRVPVAMVIVQFEVGYRVVVTGTAPGADGGEDIVVLCYDEDLGLEWMRTYSNDAQGDPVDDVPVALVAGNGYVGVIGWSDANSSQTDTGRDTVVIVYDASSSTPVFTDRYTTTGGYADVPAEAVMVDGVIYTMGTTDSTANDSLFFLKHDQAATPKLVWSAVHGATDIDFAAIGIAAYDEADANHRVYGTGYFSAETSPGDTNWITVRIEPFGCTNSYNAGEIVWQTTEMVGSGTTPGDDRPADIAAVHNKDQIGNHFWGVAVTGHVWSSSTGNQFATVLYRDNWNCGGPAPVVSRDWTDLANGSVSGGDDRGVGVATQHNSYEDNPGYIVITGRLENASGNLDIHSRKFTTYDAPPVDPPTWAITFPQSGSGNGHDVPAALHWEALVLDNGRVGLSSDNRPSLFVAGSSVGGVGSSTGLDWRIIRYVEVNVP